PHSASPTGRSGAGAQPGDGDGRDPPGVVAMPGTPESWRRTVLAHVLGYGPHAVASHRSAAAVWDLPGFDGHGVEVSKPHGRNRRLPDGRIHGSLWLQEHNVTVRDAIPVTTP